MTHQYKIGNIVFETPFLNASGCWCLSEDQLRELYNSRLGGIVTKTCTFFSREGNIEPNYYCFEKDGVHFNSKGLPNLGFHYYQECSRKFSEKPYIISIAFENFETLETLLTYHDNHVNKETLIEINLSCPNTETDIPGYDIPFLQKFLERLRDFQLQHITFGLKLPPYFQKNIIDQIVRLINTHTKIVSYIVLSNSIPNCMPLVNGKPVLSNVYGGMSGKINKNIAISNVSLFSEKLNKNITIIGCGGIETLEDVYDYLNNGARFVQIASCFYDVHANRLDIEKINQLVCDFHDK